MTGLKKKREEYREIDLKLIDEPDGRARMEIDKEDIANLASSIESFGLRQAIEVVKRGDRYEIVYGERRVLAHRHLEQKTIWAKVVKLTKDEVVLVRALENISRKNLSPIEEAVSFAVMRDEFGNPIDRIAKKVGRSPGNVKRRLALLKMPADIQKAVHSKKISVGIAEELWACKDVAHRSYLLELCIEHGVTTIIARKWVKDYEKELRTSGADNEERGRVLEPMENRPIYQPCDICDSAVDIKEISRLGICRACHKNIRNAMGK